MTEAIRRQLEAAGIKPKATTKATGKGKTLASGQSASSPKQNDTEQPATTRRTAEQLQEHRRSAKARPLFTSTVWDLSEEEPRYRWVGHDLTQAQKDYLDKAALECGVRPGH
ncbi:hypothetical protein DNI29_19085 [Hymenobacter sediminis]|uniref:hypothetical protein n=1 Tax=Hymenobacter sediminis TaxID=2218621 RepID=UPI000DA65CB8|nr:hypothetical protein [Hymenobacter sediminis]RPD45487.1 hypothetical protein DNI29_19085 [Hymenobacter sediminis]